MRNIAKVINFLRRFALISIFSLVQQQCAAIGIIESGLSLVEDGWQLIRKGLEFWSEDPVHFAHRVYGSTVSTV